MLGIPDILSLEGCLNSQMLKRGSQELDREVSCNPKDLLKTKLKAELRLGMGKNKVTAGRIQNIHQITLDRLIFPSYFRPSV